MRLQIEQNWRTVRVFDADDSRKWASGRNTYQALGHFVQGHLEYFKIGYREFHAQRQDDAMTTDFEWWGRWLIENADRLGVTILKQPGGVGAMRVLITNSNSLQTGYLAGKFPDAIGHLYSPGGQRGPYEFMPYALDNGAFGAWTNKRPFDDQAWAALLEWAKNSGQPPLWALVPDVVADKDATLASWNRFAPVAAEYGWPLAFAVQDGMSTADVPSDADVIFVGGTTEWKWANAHRFGDKFSRVHIGRVNSLKFLRLAKNARAESCDGTGWLRGDQLQFRQLVHFLAEENRGGGDFSFPLFSCPTCQNTKLIVSPGTWHESRCQNCL